MRALQRDQEEMPAPITRRVDRNPGLDELDAITAPAASSATRVREEGSMRTIKRTTATRTVDGRATPPPLRVCFAILAKLRATRESPSPESALRPAQSRSIVAGDGVGVEL